MKNQKTIFFEFFCQSVAKRSEQCFSKVCLNLWGFEVRGGLANVTEHFMPKQDYTIWNSKKNSFLDQVFHKNGTVFIWMLILSDLQIFHSGYKLRGLFLYFRSLCSSELFSTMEKSCILFSVVALPVSVTILWPA